MAELTESMERTAAEVRAALQTGDLDSFGHLLDPEVRWGPPGDPSPPCQTRDQVLSWYRRGQEAGATAEVSEVAVIGERLLVGLVVRGTGTARKRGGNALRWQVLTIRNGRVVEIVGFDERAEAVCFAEAS